MKLIPPALAVYGGWELGKIIAPEFNKRLDALENGLGRLGDTLGGGLNKGIDTLEKKGGEIIRRNQGSVTDMNNRRDQWRNNHSSLQAHQNDTKPAWYHPENDTSLKGMTKVAGPTMDSGNSVKGPIELDVPNVIISSDKDVTLKGNTLKLNADKIEMSDKTRKSFLEALGLGSIGRSTLGPPNRGSKTRTEYKWY